MRITDLLDKRSISLNETPKTKSEALDRIIDLMVASGKINDREAYREQVYAREEESTTGIGEGIAIPHGKCDAVTKPGLAAMVVKDGVEFDALDGQPVTLMFLIAAPNTKDNVHLDVLSKLSVLMMDEVFADALRNAKSADEFLDIIIDDYEDLVRDNRELTTRVKELEEKLAYFDEMKESLSQSVILAQETAEKVKASAADESANLINKANFNATRLIEEAKSKASEILRDATDEAKRVAIETEELKRQSRVFHQRLLAAVEGQLSLASAPEWEELLQPTAIYLQNSDVAFKEVVEKVLDEYVPDSNDAASFDATRQFTPDEMAELQRRVAESNKQVKDFSNPDVDETNDITSTPVYFGIEDSFESEVANFPISAPVDEDNDSEQEATVEKNLNETQTFKLNISE